MSDLVIGLTGGIGSGKTTVTNYFAELGIEIIDADIIARGVVAINSPALKAIEQYFGAEFIQSDGQLNRPLLRTRIFSNDCDKQWLNNLLHPLIRENIILQTIQAKSQYCILVAPLLIENDLLHLVDRVLVIDVSEETQLARVLERDSSSAEEIKAIISSQTSRSKRIDVADYVITNEHTSRQRTKDATLALHKNFLTLTKMV